MKLRHPVAISLAARFLAGLVRVWVGSLQSRYQALGPSLDPRRPGFDGHYLYVFWHDSILLPAHLFGRSDIHVLSSQHADGQFISKAAGHLGFRAVFGSTTRGGAPAVRRMMRLAKTGHLAVTPDGPRGPRRQVQPGVVYLASRTGLPIVPFGVGYDRPWRVNSWDRFAVPRPFSRAFIVTADPIVVPPAISMDALEPHRLRVQQGLDLVTRTAEELATGVRASSRAAA